MKLSNKCYCLTGLTHANLFSVNAGFIIGETETIIIDSGFNNEAAQTIFGYATAAKPDNKISHLINLESHYDHILGNSFFKSKNVKILAHENNLGIDKETLTKYINECNEEISIERRRNNKEANIYFDGVTAAKPDIRINKNLELKFDGMSINIYIAKGHTNTNLIVYEPNDKVLYAADTIYSKFLPTLAFGNKSLWLEWLNSLSLIESLNPKILVPGHGPILYEKDIYSEIKRHREIILKRIEACA